MRQTHALRPETDINVRPYLHPYLFPCLLVSMLSAVSANAQTLARISPQELLTGDPDAFVRLLETDRPTPISIAERDRILTSLPEEGEVTNLDPVALQKVAAVRQVLRAVQRDSVYQLKVIDIAQAAVALHARAVLLISKPALGLLRADELQALAAHEIGHEYVWSEYDRASQVGDHGRSAELELVCDAIGIIILHQMGMNTSRLIAGVEKIFWFNRERFGTARNEKAYPVMSRRRQFSRAVGEWARGAGVARSPRQPDIARSEPSVR